MKAKLSTVFVLIAVLALTLNGAVTAGPLATQAPEEPAPSLAGSHQAKVSTALRSGSVMFIENVGQFDPSTPSAGQAPSTRSPVPALSRPVHDGAALAQAGQAERARFYVHGGSSSLWLTEDALWISIVERSPVEALERPGLKPENLGRANVQPANVKSVNMKLTFPGANPNPRLEPFDRLDTVVSYFIGNDPARWHAAVPVWGGVRYVDLYPGVDLELSGENGYWTWRWVVKTPSLAPSPYQGKGWGGGLRLRVEGAEAVEVLPNGEGLRLATALGERVLPLPALEGANVTPLSVQPAKVQRLNPQTFDITASFSPALQLPLSASQVSLAYSGFLGGSLKDDGWGIAVDAAGDAYVTGGTNSSDFPAVVGSVLPYNSGDDAFVAKVKADGSGLAYAGFLGGANNDWGRDIALDASGNAYITGYTWSSDFPVEGEWPYTNFNGGYYDAFVAKVQADGSGLVYSGFLGGSGGEYGEGIAVDTSGDAYVTGVTNSSSGFPVVGGPDPSFNGGDDAFVTKVQADGSRLVYSGFLGGSGWEWGYGIAVDTSGNAYVTGVTNSSNFPVGVGPIWTFNGGEDAFVAEVQADGSGLVYSGFLGGSEVDRGAGIAVDTAGNAYITGDTMSGNFPVAGSWPYTSYKGCGYSDAFVAKVKADGSGLAYSGFLGGLGSDWGTGIAVDTSGDAYVTGVTGSSDFPVTGGWPYTSYNGGDYDAFVTKVNVAGTELVYSGFLGGANSDWGRDIAVEASGNTYVTGRTDSSSGFPVAGAWPYATFNGGYSDAFVAKVVALENQVNRIYLPLILRDP
jgi:hypothetical protein